MINHAHSTWRGGMVEGVWRVERLGWSRFAEGSPDFNNVHVEIELGAQDCVAKAGSGGLACFGMKKMNLTALLEREGSGFVSLCPEFDIASEGESVEEAMTNLKEAVELFLECAPREEVQRRYAGEVIISRFEAPYA